jgi:hypothetical protein
MGLDSLDGPIVARSDASQTKVARKGKKGGLVAFVRRSTNPNPSDLVGRVAFGG